MSRTSAIKKIIALRAYLVEAGAAVPSGIARDRIGLDIWLGNLAFERLTDRSWSSGRGGIFESCWAGDFDAVDIVLR